MESDPPERRPLRLYLFIIILFFAAPLFVARVCGTEPPEVAPPADYISVKFLWVLLACFLGGSAFFSGSETSLFSLDKVRLSKIEQKHPRGYFHIKTLLSEPQNTLTSILFMNTFVNIGATLTAGAIAESYFTKSPILSFLTGAFAVTLLILTFGEIMPKSIAIERPEKFALFCSPPLIFISRIITPFRYLLDLLKNRLFRIFGFTPVNKTETFTEEDLKMMLMSGEIDGVIEEDEREMIDGVFELGDKNVAEIMTPRTDLEAYPNTLSQKDLITQIKNGNHSRVLIYEEDIDHITGVLHVKDLLLSPERRFVELIRSPLVVPEKKELTTLLWEMQRHRNHVAIVVDEYGGVAGMVTLNDLLEEIVGDLRDAREIKKEYKDIIRIAAGHYHIQGKIEVSELNEALGMHLDEEIARTLSGYVFNTLGRLPEEGEGFTRDGWQFRIMRISENRIERITIKRISKRMKQTRMRKEES